MDQDVIVTKALPTTNKGNRCISESWKELKSTTMRHAWTKIWPECGKSIDAEVIFLPQIRQNILDLAHYFGFEGLNERDVLDLLETDRELIYLQAEPVFDDKREPVVSKLSNAVNEPRDN